MTAFRATILTAACLPLALLASPAAAQVDDDVVLSIMRQCARIDEASARLACFDNNIRVGNTDVTRPSVPGAMPRPQGGASAPITGATGFGSEDVRRQGQSGASAAEAEADEMTGRIRSATEQNAGMYLVTLEDGAQWLFTESVGLSYRPPTAGATVKISRASMGSFLMEVGSQRSVRVRRVR